MQTINVAQIESAVKNGTLNRLVPKETHTIQGRRMMNITNMEELPIRHYLVERLQMSPGHLILLCATGCSGKTWLATYLATCISTGKPVFDAFPCQQGAVVHIDMEQSEDQTHRRYIRLANGLGVKSIDVMRVTLKKRLDDHSLPTGEVEQEITELCTGKALCIIDSLRAISATDENSSEIGGLLKMLKLIGEKTGCTMLVIHHKGKGRDAKQSGRGSSAIYDSADVQIDLDVANEVYELSCAKNREGKYFDGINYQLIDAGEYSLKQHCTSQLRLEMLCDNIKPARQSQREKIITALTENGNLKHNDLFDIVRGDRTKFGKVLDAMMQSQEITEAPGPRNSKLYSLK